MTKSSSTPRKRDGTLRASLINAGIELLRDRGPDGLSLRECAAKAGVSHAAPGYHFKNLMGLSTAIAAKGFAVFANAMQARLDKAGTDPKDRLAAICYGYLDFAEHHPELFLFIFSGQKFGSDDPDYSANAGHAYGILRAACAPLIPPSAHPEEIEILVWSLVHGYAHLAMTRKLDNPNLERAWPGFEPVIKHVLTLFEPASDTRKGIKTAE
ncbi:TetR/AcrR family transcriptional regulator [Labrenzia sp. PHM005]|uniref:TetR/AcrR family transcriptional regulator n=1 Tax=Labrenzia sp. PHM005 TaxID=2590016 RepID=UPI0011402E21|nr:WHG domain-containing protein [Labrenzia sp. PHM005]QDG77171.1 TetR/AcrR family transcriptional regulator [Labrenzia sp. PHM005]